MAEGSRRYVSNQPLDISQILLEAQHRWLRPSEVCEILSNYQKFQLTPDPPYKPPGGSLFLFDRKALRYFRKDGHQWRKKKDGKTVREAHEKLKAGSVDVLHCYYAHGEDNENFQRRSYWMLDGKLEHIVLVHYREVKEGNRSGTPRLLNADSAPQPGSAPSSTQTNSCALTVQASYASSPSTAHWNGQTPLSEFEDVDSGDDLGTSSLAEAVSCSEPQNVSDTTGLPELPKNYLAAGLSGSSFGHQSSSSMWTGLQSSDRNTLSMQEQSFYFDQLNDADIITRKLTDAKLDTYCSIKDNLAGDYSAFPDRNFPTLIREAQRTAQGHQKNMNAGCEDYLSSDKGAPADANNVFRVPHKHDLHLVHPRFQNNPGSCMTVAANELSLGFENNAPIDGSCDDKSGELKKLDSFGRWMDKEIGGDCDDSLMASDSGNYWKSLDTQNDDKEVSSLSRHIQLDIDSLGPSLSQEQLFSICDFSPDWAYSGVKTKVLVTGKFMGDVKPHGSTKWCCMFGEVEVSAEVLTYNVLRCQTPLHAPGRVPFYVTCSNRLACSEVREFEFHETPPGVPFSIAAKSEPQDEMQFQIRFAKMLHLGSERKWLDCSLEKCDKCSLKNDLFSMRTDDEKEWGQIVKASLAFEGTQENPQEALIQKLLKDRLHEWLVCKVHEGGKGPNLLDDEGQCVIHLAAALGYDWAIGPIVAAGINTNFRDACGRTGLHWAAYFGREETVVALVKLGAAPGALEDPTPKFPGGRTAADLASSRGHKGIAGYLAEADLTSHLSSMTIKENVMDSVAAILAADKAIETAEEQSVVPPDGGMEEQLSLKGSLAAVRKSARAAALIQAAFRARSFQQRRSTKNEENFEVSTDLIALASLNKAPRMSHFSDYLHSAAVKIQQKYRGWKGRKEFLKIRHRIVKIQAHVRGHQVRKQYKKVIWSVSIVEKAILRWRRKGAGLRGFRAQKAIGNVENEIGKTDEYDYLRQGRKQKVAGVEKALARVHSMVRYPEARDQYMRLVSKFQKSKMEDEGSSKQSQVRSFEKDTTEEDPLAPMRD
ncbi:calmodulin-binding transcription activator 3-like isoform X2 [Telopea speciosissima]|uniref:calmodulin-binding transcription activator 3-like isoform X2 n=1 Tax=Telopea speciosissima TaxID=54955 RepID=UPI001CC82170|nr:calmodulin-binding transcription activator 3-like isoform X2 [Telopea speciosissima]